MRRKCIYFYANLDGNKLNSYLFPEISSGKVNERVKKGCADTKRVALTLAIDEEKPLETQREMMGQDCQVRVFGMQSPPPQE